MRPLGLVAAFLLTLPPPSASAAPEDCARMHALFRDHRAEVDKPDSDPATLERLVQALAAASTACTEADAERLAEIEAAERALVQSLNPIVVVPPSAVTADPPMKYTKEYVYMVWAEVPNEGRLKLGRITIPCANLDNKCFPTQKAAPTLYVNTNTRLANRRPVKVVIKGEEGKRFSATRRFLEILHDVFADAEKPLKTLEGELILKNLSNFQREWAIRHYKQGKSPKIAAGEAIRAISFGKERMKKPFSYRKFEVKLSGKESVELDLGDGRQAYVVPETVKVVASMRRP